MLVCVKTSDENGDERMQLGWIDFSKNERNKVLSVLDLLSEEGTLDELGIAPIRDGYANLFFPGTSTIQTRAKYFLCIPYAFKDLEKSEETNPKRMLKSLYEKEKSCGECLHRNSKTDGVIGASVIDSGKWVKRQPSDIYWAGIRRLGIFVGGNKSINEYLRYICFNNSKKDELKNLGNRKDNAEENECDDLDAGHDLYKRFWNLPTYNKKWLDNISIDLTKEEAKFLKEQIIQNCKEESGNETMFSFIMKENKHDFVDIKNFEDLASGYIRQFPEHIQTDYYNAVKFSEFVYVLRVLYNVIVSNSQNEEANNEWQKLEPNLYTLADIDIESIYHRLGITKPLLLRFLLTSQTQMRNGDIEGLKETIIKREVDLKGSSRAKTKHAGEFRQNSWFGGRKLDYRFPDAQTIINDIFEGEKNCAESK